MIEYYLYDSDYINYCKAVGIQISLWNFTRSALHFLIHLPPCLIRKNEVCWSTALRSKYRGPKQYTKAVEELLREFEDCFDDFDWRMLSQYQVLSEDFMEDHQDKVEWRVISKHQSLSEDFMERHLEWINWRLVSEHQTLSLGFIREYQDRVVWKYICGHQRLTSDFIREFIDKIDWYGICRYQSVPEDLLEYHMDKLFWPEVSEYQALSPDFIRRHENDLDWWRLSNRPLERETLVEFRDNINFYCASHWLPEELIEEFRDYVSWSTVSDRPLSLDFVRKNSQNLQWYVFSKHITNPEIAREFYQLVDWEIIQNRFSPEFLVGFIDQLEWKSLSKYLAARIERLAISELL